MKATIAGLNVEVVKQSDQAKVSWLHRAAVLWGGRYQHAHNVLKADGALPAVPTIKSSAVDGSPNTSTPSKTLVDLDRSR